MYLQKLAYIPEMRRCYLATLTCIKGILQDVVYEKSHRSSQDLPFGQHRAIVQTFPAWTLQQLSVGDNVFAEEVTKVSQAFDGIL